MNHNSISSRLKTLTQTMPCVALDNHVYNIVEMLSLAHENITSKITDFNKTFLLVALPPFELILTLITLDGLAKEIIILSNTSDLNYIQEMKDNYPEADMINFDFFHKKSVSNNTPPPQYRKTQWSLTTSGTTNKPKIIHHSFETLSQSVKSGADLDLRWGLIYDPARFAGLMVTMQALLSHSLLVLSAKTDFKTQMDAFLANKVNALSATPSLWRKMLLDGHVKHLPLKQITCGGEIADEGILNALQTAFPQARIVHIYASTEAGSSFLVADKKAGFPAVWLNNEAAKVKLSISEDNTLLIKPKLLPKGDEIAQRLTKNGYIDTQDLIEVKNDRVYFKGRQSGAINVGGNKVIPEEIETVILAIEGVRDCLVYSQKSSIMGQLVAAKLVIAEGLDPKIIKKSIIEACRLNLESWKVPAIVKFDTHIDYSPAGKKLRNIT